MPLAGSVAISRPVVRVFAGTKSVGRQAACASHDDPCTETFIGDYFGLAISGTQVYGLFVSTHYPSSIRADEGGPVRVPEPFQRQALLELQLLRAQPQGLRGRHGDESPHEGGRRRERGAGHIGVEPGD